MGLPPNWKKPAMTDLDSSKSRLSPAQHAYPASSTLPEEIEQARRLREEYEVDALKDLYGRHIGGLGAQDSLMRRVIWRALCKSCGENLQVGAGALFRNIETFEIGDHVSIGHQSYIQGMHDGHCVIGSHVWIGPQAFMDARNLELGAYVGWGPAARSLESQHTGRPSDVPLIQTDLEIQPVRIQEGADIGTGATIMPGITVGQGAIVGAAAVVTHDVKPYAVVAGIPARFMRWRDGFEPNPETV